MSLRKLMYVVLMVTISFFMLSSCSEFDDNTSIIEDTSKDNSAVQEISPNNDKRDSREDSSSIIDEDITNVKLANANSSAEKIYNAVKSYTHRVWVYGEGLSVPAGDYKGVIEAGATTKHMDDPIFTTIPSEEPTDWQEWIEDCIIISMESVSDSFYYEIRINEQGFPMGVIWSENEDSECKEGFPRAAEEKNWTLDQTIIYYERE